MQFGNPKLVKRVTLGKKGRKSLIKGINTLASAVGSTLGAGGRNVVLEDDFGNPHVTKDGVTVANYINAQDPLENIGIQMVKQAAQNTASKAGDGTTTSTVLARAIIDAYDKLKGEDHSFRDIASGIKKAMEQTIKILDYRSVSVDNKRLESVSIISTNNDTELGREIAKAFRCAGDHGIVTVETSSNAQTFVDLVEGTNIKSNSKSHHFLTSPEKELCELERPLIFLCASKIPNVRRIQSILEYAITNNRSILLVAELEGQPLSALAMNKVNGNLKVNVIDPPSFGLKRQDLLSDLALLSGAKVIDESLGDSLELISPDCLGSAKKCVSNKDGTTFIFDNTPSSVEQTIETLKAQLGAEDHHVLTRHLEERLAILSGGVAQIYVGADTEVELKEKKDRVDDAISAVKAAKKEGILPGGGTAFIYAAKKMQNKGESQGEMLGWEILLEALLAPFETILDNAGIEFDWQELDKWGYGVDVIDGRVKDMRKAGIIDPTLVAKEALRNAVSVATTILSTDAVVSNVRQENNESTQ